MDVCLSGPARSDDGSKAVGDIHRPRCHPEKNPVSGALPCVGRGGSGRCSLTFFRGRERLFIALCTRRSISLQIASGQPPASWMPLPNPVCSSGTGAFICFLSSSGPPSCHGRMAPGHILEPGHSPQPPSIHPPPFPRISYFLKRGVQGTDGTEPRPLFPKTPSRSSQRIHLGGFVIATKKPSPDLSLQKNQGVLPEC